jgi:hypothetical protein
VVAPNKALQRTAATGIGLPGVSVTPVAAAAELGHPAIGGFSVGKPSKPDFLSAFGEEFCTALSPPVPSDLITPHGGYEVWRRAFAADPTPAALAELSDPQVEQLRSVSAKSLCVNLQQESIAGAVGRREKTEKD